MIHLYGLLVLVGVIFSRPMVLGYFNATLGLAFFVAAILMASCISFKRLTLPNNAHAITSSKLLLINILFGSIYSIMVSASSLDRGAKIATIIWISSFSLYFSTASSRFAVSIINLSRITLRLVVFSGVLTATVFVINKYSIHDQMLVLVEIPIKDRGFDYAQILLPLSTILNDFTGIANILPRSSYLMIEPGIAPALLVLWRILEKSESTVINLGFDFVFILALTTTLSTSAPIVATFYFVGRKLFLDAETIRLKSVFAAGILILLGAFIFLYAPDFGYLDKQVTHGDSFTERADWYSAEDSIRTETALLLLIYFFIIFPFLPREKFILLPTLYLIAAINVLAFTPFIFISISILLALNILKIQPQRNQAIGKRKTFRLFLKL